MGQSSQVVCVPVPLSTPAIWDVWIRICISVRERIAWYKTEEGFTYHGHPFEGPRCEKRRRVLRIADKLRVVIRNDWGRNEVTPMTGNDPQYTSVNEQ